MLYKRSELAKRLSSIMLSKTFPLTSMLLAAPRRTGKSTFVLEDLKPELEKNGSLVIYVDLWSNKTVDPSVLIANAVLEKMKDVGAGPRWLSGVENVELSISGIGLSVGKDKKEADLTFGEALSSLSLKTKKKIVLIVDEFQHALSSQSGENTLFALKSARDKVNTSDHFGMVILGTGSNQDKLASMRNSKDQAFYLTQLSPLPKLERDFTDWLIDHSGLSLNKDVAWELFVQSGSKPEALSGVIRNLQLRLDLTGDLTEVFEKEVKKVLTEDAESQKNKINALPTSQWVVLAFMSQGLSTGLNSQASREEFKKIATARGETINFDANTVQAAISGLQNKKLIWSEARGTYHIEDEQVSQLIKEMLLETLANKAQKPKMKK